MPRKCCVPCCRSNYKTETTSTTTFGFPKDEELKKKWISSINRKDFLPGSTAAVCINHFDEQHLIWEYRIPQKDGSAHTIERKRPRLADGAYPTKFPNQPHYLSEDLPKTRKSPSLRKAEEITRAENQFSEWCEADNIKSLNEIKENVAEKVKDPWQHTVKENSIFIYKIETSDCPKVSICFQILSNLTVNIFYENARLDTKSVLGFVLGNDLKLDKWTKFDCVLSHLNSFEAKEMSVNQKLSVIKILLHELIEADSENDYSEKLKFISAQLTLAFCKKIRYDSDIILWCANLYFRYPSAYLLIRKTGSLTLPHQTYLRRFTTTLSMDNEDNIHVKYLKEKGKLLKEHEKLVNLLLDEIYITPKLDYKGGEILGIADNSEECVAASTVQTFMVSSLFSSNKEVVSLVPVKNMTAEDLLRYTKRVMYVLHDSGYQILSLISDNNRINRKMFTAMCGGTIEPSIPHPHDAEKRLFFLFDTPHLIKSVRNNWLNQTSTNQTFFYPNPLNNLEIKIASILHLKSIYDSECNSIVKSAPKLNRKVLFPSSIERQNVKHALGIFHETTIAALEQGTEIFHRDFLQTKLFLEHMSKWWKIVNCKHYQKGRNLRDQFCDAIFNLQHPSLQFLRDFCVWMKKWKVLNELVPNDRVILQLPETGGMLSKETEFALEHTTRTLILVAEYVFLRYAPKYILFGKFQTDNLEARFGEFRQMSGGNYNVSFRQVIESERKLKILGLIQLHSKEIGQFSITSLDCSDKDAACSSQSMKLPPDHVSDIITASDKITVIKETVNVLIYIAGYVAFKVQKRLSCEDCMKSLATTVSLELETQSEDFHYLNLIDRGGLKWPQPLTITIVMITYKIFQVIVSKYENVFRSNDLKITLMHITMEKIIICNSITATMCSCGMSSDVLAQKCLSVISNVFINNYCKAKNDLLLKSKSTKQKRKLSTVSNNKKEKRSKVITVVNIDE